MRTTKVVKILLMVGFLVGVFSLFVPYGSTPSKGAAPNKESKKTKINTPVDPSKYVGNESCAECHANESAHFSVTAHRKTLSESFPVDQRGCEACHGGAKLHVEFHKTTQKLYEEGKATEAEAMMADTAQATAAKLRYFNKLTSEEASAVCLSCHENHQGRSEERFNFRRSEHSRHGVSCLDCHSSHAPQRTEFLLRDSQPNLCYSCHMDQKAAFNRPFHHKVPEGTMKCSDCHNQHGGFQSKQLRSWVGNDVTCLKCHADKSGPFVYEHAPVKIEGCQACHTPHGSTNPRLLNRNEVRFLCLECHSNTPTTPGEPPQGGVPTPSFHNLALPRFQNCTTCHRMIHGSNVNRTYFR
ncbi:MAG: DmsE family decaheme c-type cytochrome [Blastocatellia bacterium]|nr:DmsE family decaheme c-type cytochrome [Blastocatellia bacterium]